MTLCERFCLKKSSFPQLQKKNQKKKKKKSSFLKLLFVHKLGEGVNRIDFFLSAKGFM